MTAEDVRAHEWRTEPDGPGSGDDRYGDLPAQEAATGAPVARGDRPRKIVVCSPIQQGVTALGHGDVLVKPSEFVDDGRCYVIDGRLVEGLIG